MEKREKPKGLDTGALNELTDNQWDVLSGLAYNREYHALENRAYIRPEDMEGKDPDYEWGWYAPIDLGGTNGSHHSATATALAKKGLVDRNKNGRINFFQSRIKGSCKYRITDTGYAVYRRERDRRRGVR